MSSDSQAIKDLHAAFAKQRSAFWADPYPSIETRKTNLHKIAGMMMANRQPIRDALTADFGTHPEGVTDLVEVLGPAGRAMYAAGELEKWTAHQDRFIDPAVSSQSFCVITRY